MNTVAAVIASIVMAAGITTWLAMSYRATLKTYRSLRQLPRRTVATLQAGERAYVVGTARAGKLTESLVSKRACILYAIRMHDGPDPGATVIGEDFEVEDETGRVRICANGAYDTDLAVSRARPIEVIGTRFGKGVVERNLALHQDRPYEDESILVDGARVAVGGTVERVADGTLRIVGAASSPVYVIDVERRPALAKGG